ncbi:MAG TPA: response regulator transcription factor [Vicinamibacteria bacterium]
MIVLLVGEDPLALAGLASLLAARGVTVAAEASPGDDLPALVAARAPDVVLWDLGPGAAGSLREIGAPLLALVGAAERGDEALAGGARGLVFRDSPAERLVAAAEAVARGLVVVEDALSRRFRREAGPAAPDLVEPLTPREGEVLQLLAQGLPNRAIAARLGISDHTVKFHVNAILTKLGAATRTEAVAQAVRTGLVLL